ncbi:hypothetical protein XENTR_v10004970 [Xenopus tropicalis]|nr:hypothetical protein XENTR_v10004970 [Xenopus tropicalis]
MSLPIYNSTWWKRSSEQKSTAERVVFNHLPLPRADTFYCTFIANTKNYSHCQNELFPIMGGKYMNIYTEIGKQCLGHQILSRYTSIWHGTGLTCKQCTSVVLQANSIGSVILIYLIIFIAILG